MRRLTLLDAHLTELRGLLFPSSGHESMAYVLCGHAGDKRYLSHRVIPLPMEHVLSTSASHITADTGTLRRLLKIAANEKLTIAVVHSHRPGPALFSPQDDTDEPKLVELAQHRNGTSTRILSMIVAETGAVAAREWHSAVHFEPLRVLSIGQRIAPLTELEDFNVDDDTYARQLLALGPAFQRMLAGLRVAIVGAGATGSAIAVLLARLGVQFLTIVDNDVVEISNLNRLHGALPDDARQARSKVDALSRHLETFRPGIHIDTFDCLVNDATCRRALTACDVAFGCTDDHDGRLWINRLAYFYSIPVIDIGIGIDYEPGCSPRILDAAGRVTVIMPGQPCLLCRGIIDQDQARADALRRENPVEYQRLSEEAYVRGAGLPNPAVVSYTTEVACMAIDELIERLTGYRQIGAIAHRIRKFRLGEDKRPGFVPTPDECPICGSCAYWGRGDITPFMDRLAA